MDIDVLLVADARGENMLPLTQRTCPALLPICGRSAIDHVLESLIPLSVNKVQILVGGFSAQVRQFVGNGDRWGVDIECLATRGNSTPEDVIRSDSSTRDRPCLVIDTRIFCSLDLVAAITVFASQDAWLLQASSQGEKSGIYYFDLAKTDASSRRSDTPKDVPLAMDICQDITSLESYYQLNLMIARERPERILIRGQQKLEDVIAGPGCVIEAANIENCKLFAGIGCRLHPEVRCSGTVVLGDNVVVDRHTVIKDSLILDKTFIGEHLHVENAIIWRNHFIRVDRNTSITLEDDRLLGSLSNTAISTTIGSLIGRLMAAVALVLSTPLWVLAFIESGLQNGLSVFQRTRFYGNPKQTHQPHREFKGFEFQSRFKVLARLPVLLDMVLGRVNWFGVSICSPQQLMGRTEPWQLMRDDYSVGLLGPAQLELDDDSSMDARLMADATFLGCTRRDLLKAGLKKVLGLGQASALQSKLSSR